MTSSSILWATANGSSATSAMDQPKVLLARQPSRNHVPSTSKAIAGSTPITGTTTPLAAAMPTGLWCCIWRPDSSASLSPAFRAEQSPPGKPKKNGQHALQRLAVLHQRFPSDASKAFDRPHGARCGTTGQDAPQACFPFAAIRRSTSPQKWWGLQWQGKLSPDSPSMAISLDGRKYTVHFRLLSGPNVNITVKSSNSDTRHGAYIPSR